jgi:hypothetical protein
MRTTAVGLFGIALGLAACEPMTETTSSTTPRRPHPVVGGIHDPITQRDQPWMHAETERVMRQMIASLGDNPRSEVEGVALEQLDMPGVVNAFAGCEGLGRPIVGITDEMLDIMAHLAQARAAEELFDVDATNAYTTWMFSHQPERGPLVEPPDGREDPRIRDDKQKIALQHLIFDEEVGWVIGHELAHHYLGHTRCDQDGGIVDGVRDLAIAIVPAAKQPDELAADAAGIDLVLNTARRTNQPYSQRGALLVLDFFARTHPTTAQDIVFLFALTHPPTEIRLPALRAVTAAWFLTNGHLPIIPVPKI